MTYQKYRHRSAKLVDTDKLPKYLIWYYVSFKGSYNEQRFVEHTNKSVWLQDIYRLSKSKKVFNLKYLEINNTSIIQEES